MTKLALTIAMALSAFAAPALAGDAAAGEKVFMKCKACHSIIADDGTAIQKGGATGPNLYGVIGRVVGSEPSFAGKYDDATVKAGSDGTVWTEAMLAEYVQDPTKWLQAKTGDAAARSKMTFKLAKGGEDVAAYLASLKPAQ